MYLLTYLLTSWSRILLEKLTILQLVKKCPAFSGTWRFITAFTSAWHLSLSWASSIWSIPPHHTFWRSSLIIPFHLCLGLSIGHFPSGFPIKTLYSPPPSPIRTTCPAHLILIDFIPARKWVRSTDRYVPHCVVWVTGSSLFPRTWTTNAIFPCITWMLHC
jgi:hypothetical protein